MKTLSLSIVLLLCACGAPLGVPELTCRWQVTGEWEAPAAGCWRIAGKHDPDEIRVRRMGEVSCDDWKAELTVKPGDWVETASDSTTTWSGEHTWHEVPCEVGEGGEGGEQ